MNYGYGEIRIYHDRDDLKQYFCRGNLIVDANRVFENGGWVACEADRPGDPVIIFSIDQPDENETAIIRLELLYHGIMSDARFIIRESCRLDGITCLMQFAQWWCGQKKPYVENWHAQKEPDDFWAASAVRHFKHAVQEECTSTLA
jgi:hypothetical protein